jgi:hypothetical protein
MDLTVLSDEELEQLSLDIRVEQRLREIPQSIHVLNLDYLAKKGIVPGQEWVQPTGPFDSYPLDWTVTYGGKTWVSTVRGNVWQPGVEAWNEVVPEGAPPPDWVQPGSTNGYMKGAQVTFNGVVYTSLIDNNVWSPADYPTGWQADPPA